MNYGDELKKWRASGFGMQQPTQTGMPMSMPVAMPTPRNNDQGNFLQSLGSVLGGAVEGFKDFGKSAYDMFGTGSAAIKDLIESGGRSSRNQDEFRKSLYKTNDLKDASAKGLGTAVSGASTVSTFIPGLNVVAKHPALQGAIEGAADQLKYGGSSASMDDILGGAVIGGATGKLGDVVGGKLGQRALKNPATSKIGRALQSSAGRGAITGASAGALGGGLGSFLYTPQDQLSLGGVLQSALKGATGGAMGGAVAGGAMGKASDFLDKQRAKTAEMQSEYGASLQKQKYLNQADKASKDNAKAILSNYDTIRLGDQVKGAIPAAQDMADLGLYDRPSIDNFANRLTGSDGVGSKLIRNIMLNSGEVSSKLPVSMDDILSSANADAPVEKNVKNTLKAISAKYPSENGKMSRADMYDLGREIEREGYTMAKKADRVANPQRDRAYSDALISLSDEILMQATKGIDVKGNLTPDVVNQLKGVLPGNDKWSKRIDMLASKKNLSIGDLRSLIAPATKMSLYGQATDKNFNTYGQNTPKTLGGKREIANMLLNKAMDSDTARAQRIAKNNQIIEASRAQANAMGEDYGYRPQDMLRALATGQNRNFRNYANNAIGREAGITQGRYAQNRAMPQAPAMALMQMMQGEPMQGMTAQNAPMMPMQAGQAQLANSGAQMPQGAEYGANMAVQQDPLVGQIEQLGNMMQAAMSMGEMGDYAKLAGMYQDALKLYAMRQELAGGGAEEPIELDKNQANALTAKQQLDTLMNLTPSGNTALSEVPFVGGQLNKFAGGDPYTSQSKALALTIGFMLSGANVPAKEAENIGMAYVPSMFDSEEVRQQKAETVRRLANNYLQGTPYAQ